MSGMEVTGHRTTMLLSELQAFSEAAIARRGRDTSTSDILLGLRAGAGDLHKESVECLQNSFECVGPDPGFEDERDVLEEDVAGEPAVMVGNTLLALLKAAVQEQFTNFSRQQHRCVFPFRSFQSLARMREHVQKYHVAARQYVCSGTKQLKICCAFENDQVTGAARGYRRAQILRDTVTSALPASMNEIGRHIRLLLTLRGPDISRLSTVVNCESARRVSNLVHIWTLQI